MAETCPACRRPTRTVLTRLGLRLALDPTPSEHGTVVIEQLRDGAVRGRVIAGHDPDAPGDTVLAYRRHSCSAVDARPLCRACELPMGRLGNAGDAELVRREKWTSHPHCCPAAAAERARWAARRARAAGVQGELQEAS
jgi:hypothetical protein